MKKNGFTLIELLVVIVILSILITLGSKGLRTARISANKAQAMVEMKSIETAIKSYINEYGKLPVAASDQGTADPEASDSFSREIINILTGANTNDNPRELVFLEPQSARVAATNSAFFDPWGVPYQIMLDTDYDGEVDYDDTTLRRKVAIVSVGLYELRGTGNTNDIIRSWQ
jgi:prepilin-type N-terminal cleavage/methylation domain-containing protein